MKNKVDSLGDRMKFYESINRSFIIPKLHTVLRLDGKSFHTFTKRFNRPFDNELIEIMDKTAIHLCSNIQGAKFAFVQSDEIQIYLSDTDELETQMWYGGNIQKMTSVSAAIATSKFNQLNIQREMFNDNRLGNFSAHDIEGITLAEFDSRVFQVPNAEEVVNVFLWRQQDCTRNSIQSVAQSMYSQKELHGKNTSDLQELIFQKGINWNDYDAKLKRGRFITKNTYVNGILVKEIKKEYVDENQHKEIIFHFDGTSSFLKESDVIRTKWESVECPIFSQDRNFLLSKM